MAEVKRKKPKPGTGLRALEMHFQPVYDIHLNMTIDYEVTVRINDPKLGVILPQNYVPIAEKTGQIVEIGRWCIEEACDVILRCEKRGADINTLIIPASVRHLSQKGFYRHAVKTVEKAGVPAEKICFNINESILEKEKTQVLANITALRKYGFLVSIDDFGVEFTSLSRLGHYEVDYIGIHSSLLEGILSDERAQNMLQGIIDFAKKLDTRIKVNGVDSQQQADLLRLMGADQMKGALYGTPILEKSIS